MRVSKVNTPYHENRPTGVFWDDEIWFSGGFDTRYQLIFIACTGKRGRPSLFIRHPCGNSVRVVQCRKGTVSSLTISAENKFYSHKFYSSLENRATLLNADLLDRDITLRSAGAIWFSERYCHTRAKPRLNIRRSPFWETLRWKESRCSRRSYCFGRPPPGA